MKKILIVDDSPVNVKVAREALKYAGYETLTASNGKEGVETAFAEKPGLILMDIQMPVMDGVEALKILRGDSGTSATPVIALTAFAMKGDRERFMEEGFDDYLAKPISISALIEKARRFLK